MFLKTHAGYFMVKGKAFSDAFLQIGEVFNFNSLHFFRTIKRMVHVLHTN